MKSILLFFLLLISMKLFAQSGPVSLQEREEFLKNLKEQFAQDHKMMDKYFKSSFLKKFNDLIIDKSNIFLNGMAMPNSAVKHIWSEVKDKKILKILVVIKKNAPLDIKIKDNTLTINGTVEKINQTKTKSMSFSSTSIMSFKKVIQIPSDVDATKPKYEIKKGHVLIIFSKLTHKKGPNKKIVPLKFSKDDVTI